MELRMEPARCRPFHLFATITTLLLLLAASACAAAAPCSDAEGCSESAGLQARRGPVGSVRQDTTLTVDGILKLELENDRFFNWFGVGLAPGDSEGGFTGFVPTGYGNEDSAVDVPIVDEPEATGGIEFGVRLSTSSDQAVVEVDLNNTGFIRVVRASEGISNAANITLSSTLFQGATNIIVGSTGIDTGTSRSAFDKRVADKKLTKPKTPVHTQATVQQSSWINASLSGDTVTLRMDDLQWSFNGDFAEFQLEFAPAGGSCDVGVCCNGNGGFLNQTVCRHASRCELESRCNGVSPDCPASNKPNGHHCPWSPPNTLPKRGYHPYSNAAPLATNPTYEHKWHECDGVCFDGVCALAWESPECCHVAGRHGYYDPREEEEHYGRRYDAADAKAADDTAGTQQWEAGDLYCRR